MQHDSTKQNKIVWNLIQLHEFWIRLTKFDSTTGKMTRKKQRSTRSNKNWIFGLDAA